VTSNSNLAIWPSNAV